MSRKARTNEEFLTLVYEAVGDEYTFTDEYKTAKIKIGVTHNVCGYKYEVPPHSFLRGNRCIKCHWKKLSEIKKTPLSEIQSEMHRLTGGEYLLTGGYTKAGAKADFLHVKCGLKYRDYPSRFLDGMRCPKCDRGTYKKRTHKDFVEDMRDIVGDEYTVLGEFYNMVEKVLIRHNTCGNSYMVKPSNFINVGRRCMKCHGEERKTTEFFSNELAQLVDDEYSMIGEYEGANTKTLFLHNLCGNEYSVAPSTFLGGSRCPKCRSSKGEKAISGFLTAMNIKHDSEYRIEECSGIRTLPFDFSITKNNEPILMIEYDGQQHFSPTAFGNGFSSESLDDIFARQKLHDKIKNDYCFDNNIPLLRIPYWDFENIEEILFDKLVESGIIEEIKI